MSITRKSRDSRMDITSPFKPSSFKSMPEEHAATPPRDLVAKSVLEACRPQLFRTKRVLQDP